MTIQRVGGMLPTMRPSVAHEVDTLDGPTREALMRFVADGNRVK